MSSDSAPTLSVSLVCLFLFAFSRAVLNVLLIRLLPRKSLLLTWYESWLSWCLQSISPHAQAVFVESAVYPCIGPSLIYFQKIALKCFGNCNLFRSGLNLLWFCHALDCSASLKFWKKVSFGPIQVIFREIFFSSLSALSPVHYHVLRFLLYCFLLHNFFGKEYWNK